MATPFKMKGSPMQRNFGIGGSPMRDEKKKDKRSTGRKIWDKATQIGMGAKAAMKEMTRNIDPSDFGRDERTPVADFKKAYNREKKTDEKQAKK